MHRQKRFPAFHGWRSGPTLVEADSALADTANVDAIQERQEIPELIRRLPKMTAGIVPITDDERWARISKPKA